MKRLVGTVCLTFLSMAAVACAQHAQEVPVAKVRTTAEDDAHPGKKVYLANCSMCHDNAATGAPSQEAIRTLNRASIRYTLELGYMQQQAKNVAPADLAQLIDWLPKAEGSNDSWAEKARCRGDAGKVILKNAKRTAVTFGVTDEGTRTQSAAQAGLVKGDFKNLEVAWAIAFPQTATMRSQPVIVGQTIFVSPTDTARLYALDVNSGCVKWSYSSDYTLRSSLTFAEPTEGSPAAIIMGDAAGFVHAVDAASGKKLWVTDVKLTRLNRLTGAPVVKENKVFVPVSVIEATFPTQDDYACCTAQGAVVALDRKSGKQVWLGRTIEQDAAPIRTGRTGTQQFGPSGAMIWSTPILDHKRGQLYVGTGENLSWPATETSDAIIAYDFERGEKKWIFQGTKADIFNTSCPRSGANCEWPGDYQSPDFDFGATSMLIKRPDGSELVIAGQKSGVVWALNPDTGKQVWGNKVGLGSAMGGIHWGMAYDAATNLIFAPSNDNRISSANPNFGPALHALNADNGEIVWSYKPNARDCGADVPVAKATTPEPKFRMMAVIGPELPPAAAKNGKSADGDTPTQSMGGKCRLGMSAPPLVIDGAVVTGTTEGMLRIFDAKTGEVLFEYMTKREFPQTTNGVAGKGGSLDAAPYIAGEGTLFVQSGYGRFGPPGNVLIAFKPKKAS